MSLIPPTIVVNRLPAIARARFLPSSSAGLVALLLLSLAALPLAAQPSVEPAMPGIAEPPVKAPFVEGFVTSVDGMVVTLTGSPLLRVDVSGATIISADAGGGTATPPPIEPGAYLVAIVQLPTVPSMGPLPGPLRATSVAVRPAGMAVLSGEVQSVGSSTFSLLDRTILVDGNTAFSGYGAGGPVHGLSDLKPGMQATAWVVVSGGGLLATRVMALGPFDLPKPVSFRGVVKEIGTESWTIGDMTVGITTATRIVGDPRVGDTVDVVAKVDGPPNPMMGMPSRLVAVSIVKVVPPPTPVPGRTFTFDGTVQSMPKTGTMGLWKVGDRDVMVTGLTKISGTPKVGSLVTVTGYPMPTRLATGSAATPSPVSILATSIVTKP
jgi:hypothetical protein